MKTIKTLWDAVGVLPAGLLIFVFHAHLLTTLGQRRLTTLPVELNKERFRHHHQRRDRMVVVRAEIEPAQGCCLAGNKKIINSQQLFGDRHSQCNQYTLRMWRTPLTRNEARCVVKRRWEFNGNSSSRCSTEENDLRKPCDSNMHARGSCYGQYGAVGCRGGETPFWRVRDLLAWPKRGGGHGMHRSLGSDNFWDTCRTKRSPPWVAVGSYWAINLLQACCLLGTLHLEVGNVKRLLGDKLVLRSL